MSQFELAETMAKKGSSSAPDEPVKGGPAWNVTVTVRSSVDYWPKEDVQVWLFLRDGNLQHPTKLTRMVSPRAPPVVFDGHGPQRYDARASTRTAPWTFTEKTIEVTSHDVEVELVILPKKWVAFKVVDATTKERIGDAKLTLALGGEAKPGELTTSASADARNAELFHFDREGTSKVTLLTHGDDVWEVDSVTSE